MKFLLQGDVDAIKSYVFESSSLPQIRGGSQRLIKCEQEVEKLITQKGGRKIYCGGGSFLFEVPAAEAETIKREIELIYIKYTHVATVTVVYEDVPHPPPPLTNDTDGWAGRLTKAHQEAQSAGYFARRIAFLAAQLREAKQQRQAAPFIEAFPFGKRCDICGKRVAREKITYTEAGVSETKRICHVCFLRHETGQIHRNRGFDEFSKMKEKSLPSVPPKDLNELAESARRLYVGFVYADGNNIGGLLQKVKNDREYVALSEAITKGTKHALYEALWEVCQKSLQQDPVWPFEIINIGGDDVTLLIQAGYAWDVAIAFLERFERYVRGEVENSLRYWPDSWPKRITASVGIAVADVKHPVRYLEALATDLLKKAKAKARHMEASAINFLWLPNAIAVTEAGAVTEQYRSGDFHLTARPFTLEQARKMQEVVDVLTSWPRSLRHRWGEALERGRWAALSQIIYDLARRKGGEHCERTEKLIAALEDLATAFESERENDFPVCIWWPSKENGQRIYKTPLLDALELAELRTMRPDIQEEG